MSGDLEDFLRRAAERRRERAAGRPAPPPRRQRPEYTDSRRERDTSPIEGPDSDPIEVAEIVEESSYDAPDNAMTRAIAEQRRRIQEAERKAEKIRAQTKQPPRGKQPAASAPSAKPALPTSVDELAGFLATPGGLRQAILMKEILERPEHRW